jgi:FkbM family methyltransferase
MSSVEPGARFRRRAFLESVAQVFPKGPGFDGLRRRLRGTYEQMLSSDSMTSVLPGGEVIRIAAQYRHVTWNAQEYEAFCAAIRPGDTVIDAGANVGCYALLFGRWVGDTGRVYAFEPDPRAFEGLTRHLALNGLDAIVTPINAAVSHGTCEHAPFALAASSGISRLAGSPSDAPTIAVQTTSIDDFCRQRGITPRVMKIDVEGAELDVLRGARATIAQAKDLQLFVEMHSSLWPTMKISAHDLQQECAAQNLTAERLDGVKGDAWSLEGVAVRLRHP